MPNFIAIKQRLHEAVQTNTDPLLSNVLEQLISQQYQARFSAEQVQQFCQSEALTPVQLGLRLLPLAACYAQVPISQFYVGAVAIGRSGAIYFGANQEFANVAIQQTVHAEQSAISHAWLAGETAITDMVVNYTPCGHCRQFMNELNTAESLKIHLPHSQNNLLHSYLPDAFGPKDLNIRQVLFDPQPHHAAHHADPLVQAAINAAAASYAPYSHTLAGVALQTETGKILTGRYAENAAFNPSFLPLQSALNYYRLSGLSEPICRAVLAEKQGTTSLRQMTEMVLNENHQIPFIYIQM